MGPEKADRPYRVTAHTNSARDAECAVRRVGTLTPGKRRRVYRRAGFQNGRTFLNKRAILFEKRPHGPPRIRAMLVPPFCDRGGVAVTGLQNPEIRCRADRWRSVADHRT
jgi:hypothetical protein